MGHFAECLSFLCKRQMEGYPQGTDRLVTAPLALWHCSQGLRFPDLGTEGQWLPRIKTHMGWIRGKRSKSCYGYLFSLESCTSLNLTIPLIKWSV